MLVDFVEGVAKDDVFAEWSQGSERPTCEVEEAVWQTDDPNDRMYTHEEVMQAMQERIAPAGDKPC